MSNTSAVFQPKILVVGGILAVFFTYFLLIAIIRLSQISAEISFQPSGIFKNRLEVYMG